MKHLFAHEIKVGDGLTYADDLGSFPVRITGISDHPNSKGFFVAIKTSGRTDDWDAEVCAPAHFFSPRADRKIEGRE